MKTKTIAATLLSMCLMLAGGTTFAADEMKKDVMSKDHMAKDGMKKDSMGKDEMKK